jgi:1-aminocyclopropane-1-carboxylate synthase
MQDFFTRHFHPHYPLDPDDIFAQTGAGASVNQILMALADPGDFCMIPGPYYGVFDLDVGVNTGVKIVPIYLHQDNGLQNMFVDLYLLEAAYKKAEWEGKRITSMIITNPENPLGRCYSKQDIETFLIFGFNHDIHLIFDEIYALSSYSHLLDKTRDDPFISVLSLPYKDFIDPSLVHVIYGMSKDFAVNGFRIGYIVDQFNGPLKKALLRAW